MLIRLKSTGGAGGWIVEPQEDIGMSAVFIEKKTEDPADRSELEELSYPISQTPYVELGVSQKTLSQVRTQAGWR